MSKDKVPKEEHWLTTLILQIKVNSLAYIFKGIIFIVLVFIIHAISDGFVSKTLSVATYTIGIAIDAYFLNQQCNTESRDLEVFLFIHMLIVVAGTAVAIALVLVVAVKPEFLQNKFFDFINFGVNSFLVYATATPLLEAIVNANGNQLSNKVEGEQ